MTTLPTFRLTPWERFVSVFWGVVMVSPPIGAAVWIVGTPSALMVGVYYLGKALAVAGLVLLLGMGLVSIWEGLTGKEISR
jgi:hypothetical protein